MQEKNGNELSIVAIYFIVQLAISFIAIFVIGVLYGPTDAPNKINEMSGIISFAALGILALLFIIKYQKKLLEDIKRLSKKDIILIFISSILIIVLNTLISNILVNSNIDMNNQELINSSLKLNMIIVIITTVLFGPIVEEFVFRYSLSTIFNNNFAFILISSIIFGALHATNIAIIVYIVMGIVLSCIYIKTNKNIVASTIVHLTNNLYAIISMIMMLK